MEEPQAPGIKLDVEGMAQGLSVPSGEGVHGWAATRVKRGIPVGRMVAWSHGRIPVGRMVAAAALGVLLLLALLAYHRLDSAPAWLADHVGRVIRASPAQIEQGGGLSKLIQYKIDQQLSSNPAFKIIILGLVTGALIVVGALALYIAGEESLYSAFWMAVAGSGLDWTFTDSAHEGTWGALAVRLVSLLVSVGGMLVTALLLGIISGTIGNKVDELKKGKAVVVESGHTLIIGWV